MKLLIFTLFTVFLIQPQAFSARCTPKNPEICITVDPIRDTIRNKY